MTIIHSKIMYPCTRCKYSMLVFSNDVGNTIACENCGVKYEVILEHVEQDWFELEIKPLEEQSPLGGKIVST